MPSDTERLDWLLKETWFSHIAGSEDLELTALDTMQSNDEDGEDEAFNSAYYRACRNAIDKGISEEEG